MMSESHQPRLATMNRFSLPKCRSFLYGIRLPFKANKADRRLELCVESQEPLGLTQSTYLDEILNQPRNSPPPTEKEFEIFCQDVDQLGLAKAVKILLKTHKGEVGKQDDEISNDQKDYSDGDRRNNDNTEENKKEVNNRE